MKKILLGTTALVGAALVSQAALADAPKVTVGGNSEFEAGLVSDDQGAGNSNRAFYTRNEVSFKVDGKSDMGLGYGSEIWLQADTSGDSNGRGVNATRTFVYLDGLWGRVEMGSNYGADDTLKVDAGTIARATGGINGDWRFFANNKNSNPFIATSDLPINYGATTGGLAAGGITGGTAGGFGNQSSENLNKITYYTPKWYGLQAGLSYAPNDASRGQFAGTTSRASRSTAVTFNSGGVNTGTISRANDIWQGGVSYNGQWDQIAFGLSATGEHGNAQTAGYHDLSAWALGAKAAYLGFSVAGSYGDWGKSLRTGSNVSDNKFWTVGGAYEFGPYGVSVTYLSSKFDGAATFNQDKFRNIVVGADYKLAPGLTPYAEVAFFDQDAAGTGVLNNNSGEVFLLGTQLNF